MAYRLASERVGLALDDGLTVEVERVSAWAIRDVAARLAAAYTGADASGQLGALRALYDYFVDEAQPTWDLIDHRGPIPPTVGGMLRLPLELGLALVQGWAETLPVPEPDPETAADKVLPPGPARDKVNAALRRKGK